MNYELAKKLKDAGFPQPQHSDRWIAPTHLEEYGVDYNTYDPTLDELIEEIDGVFFDLTKLSDGWVATDHYHQGTGKTPREAAANLYIKLHPRPVGTNATS